MNVRKLIPIAILFLLSVVSLSAQNVVAASSSDDSCWTSLNALHACQQKADELAMQQAERCTSYPEFQCNPPDYKQPAAKAAAKHAKAGSKTTASSANAAVTQTSNETPSGQ